MCWSSSRTNRGTTSMPKMKPDSTISAMRPSMIALVSTTMCGSPRRPRAALAPGRRTRPTASAAMTRSWRLATVRPSIPSPRKMETAERGQVPNGSGADERHAQQEAHQQADQQAGDGRDELGGRELLDLCGSASGRDDRQVRQEREPQDDPGDDPRDDERAGVVAR